MAMAKEQDIPSELQALYDDALSTQVDLSDDWKIKARPPFRIPELQGCRTIRPAIPRGAKVSDAMCENRQVFGACVKCFNRQPQTGGATPPDLGYRGRDWWYTDSGGSGLFYYNHFIEKTLEGYIASGAPIWCMIKTETQAVVKTYKPDTPACNLNSIAVMIYEGDLAYIFLKPPEEGMTKVHLVVAQIDREIGVDWPISVSVHAVSPNWLCNELTWNNMPLLGNVVGGTVYNAAYTGWDTYDTGGAEAIAIKCNTTGARIYYRGILWGDGNYGPAFS